ncbi:MAG: putative Zn-containing alcohol dehydrogenase [Pseudonocardiales bacterium]|nr:putative Zn-containing alcohol dehydrogenase [Pseudonocardiales bacterium]
MRATLLRAVRDISLEDVADPTIQRPTDAVVTVAATCICGSDLHPYRGSAPTPFPKRAGHEFVGTVAAVGSAVTTLKVGDFVIAPFAISDGTCAHCRNGFPTSCTHGSFWGYPDHDGILADGGQGEQVRVPLADGTLVRVVDEPEAALIPDLLALSDVMATGHHAAISAQVGPGSTVVVVGDGAVGLCAVLASKRLGAARIIAMSRYADRQAVARRFGATDIVSARGADGVGEVLELLDGVGADAVLECVGSADSFQQAFDVARPGGRLGCVGAPFFQLPVSAMFGRNVGVRGGVAPVRAYLPELLDDVLNGLIHPGLVFDRQVPLAEVADGYRAMDERKSIKVLLQP